MHKAANIFDALPKRRHRMAKTALHDICQAETRRDAETSINSFVVQFRDKYPKTVEKLVQDRQTLLTFHDFPAAYWASETVNPIESTFATVRLRTKVTKVPAPDHEGW